MHNRQYKKCGFFAILLSVAAGMGGEMHLRVPGLGTIAMLDLVSYGIAIPVILMNWSRMGKFMRRALLCSFAWTGAAMVANLMNFHDPKYWLKCVSLASSSWAIIAVSYLLLKNQPMRYMWYLVGTGIGGWIALYYFRNGAIEVLALGGDGVGVGVENLIEKQIYPSIARGIFFGFVLPIFLWWRKFPAFLVVFGSLFCGFWLLINGGSRSSFGIFAASGAFGFGVAYLTKTLRAVAKNRAVMLVWAAVGCAITFGGYKYMASSGKMGENEARKLENEFGEGSRGAINGRAGFDYAFVCACESGGVGRGGHLRCHSVMANSLACEGFIGFLFWVYFYLQVLWFVSKRLPYASSRSTFILVMILSACWDVFGSPFGTRHKFFVLMAFIALCRDNPYYGVGDLFDSKMLRSLAHHVGYGPNSRFERMG